MLLHLIINSLIVGSGYGLIAMSFRLMFSVSPFFNLTLGSIATVGAYSTYYFLPKVGLLAIPIALLIAGLFSWSLEAFVYAPMRKLGASSMILLVVSLGLYTIFEAVISILFGVKYNTLGSFYDATQINFGFASIPLVQVLTIVSNFIIFFALNIFLDHTFLGKQIRAVNDSATLSHIIGIKTDRIIMIVSVVTGLILGLSGVLVGYDVGIEPTMGFNLLFKGLIAAIIGGMKNIRGAFFGALFLALVENLGVWIFSSEWKDAIAFVVFIICLYIRPQGIFTK